MKAKTPKAPDWSVCSQRRGPVTRASLAVLILPFLALASAQSEKKPGSPLDDLPSNIEVLTSFGERAVWSPQGDRIAFVHKTLGDAFEVDLASRQVQCLTCEFPNAGFFRVHYLSTGDYILIGPEDSKDPEKARWDISELWFLDAARSGPPVRLNQRLSEGVAASRIAPRISWVVSGRQYPDKIPEGITQMWVGEVEVKDGKPQLVNARKVHEDRWPDCWLEPQDFRFEDREIIFSCYQPENKSDVAGVNLESGKAINYTSSPEIYDEPEGIFPDGEYTLVESDGQNRQGDHYVDIWKLRLDSQGKDYVRLTFFTDYSGFKSSNPAVSPDGKYMAFQVARSKDAAGVGYGILLYRFDRAEK